MTIRFTQAVAHSRPKTRALTHTLRLNHHDIGLDYSSGGSQWLAQLLRQLPNLQSVLIHAHPWFDHATCLALRAAVSDSPAERPFSLRLLVATRCRNVLPASLPALLHACPALVYLDLSYTRVGGVGGFAAPLGALRDLRVLKLRGTGLVDDRLIELVAVLRTRLRSLDVAQNALTDRAVDALLAHCWQRESPLAAASTSRPLQRYRPSLTDRRAPNGELYNALTTRIVGQLELESADATGLTDLVMSDTRISAGGAAKLLHQPALGSLDIGGAHAPLYRTVQPPVGFVKSFQRFTRLRLSWDMLSSPTGEAREPWGPTSVPGGFPESHSNSTLADQASPEPSSPSPSCRPSTTSKLHVLTLTGVPSHSASTTPTDTICTLIRLFAQQDRRARLDYTLPPGTTHDSARLLVLEIVDYALSRAPASTSITGDADASTFYTAGRGDFSFFDHDDGDDERASARQQASTPSSIVPRQPMYDVVAEVAAFRQAAKAAFLAGDAESGHWLGRVEARRAREPD